jgi:hypothetical protein
MAATPRPQRLTKTTAPTLSRGWIGLAAACLVLPPALGDDQPPPQKPWMVSEANLPEGYPPPGPIDEVIVKRYPPHRLARVRTGGDAASGSMFWKLFNHIKRNDIKMTAPVEMSWPPGEARATPPAGGEPAAMAFLYGKASLGTLGADPQDAAVTVEDVPALQVASIGIRGAYDRATFDRGLARLLAWLAEHPEWVVVGEPRSLNYNSPFVPNIAKVAEIQIPVRPREEPRPAP